MLDCVQIGAPEALAFATLGRWLGKPDHASGEARVDWGDGAAAAAAGREPGVRLVTPAKALCRNDDCRFLGTAGLYYCDQQHLTPVGAQTALAELAQRRP